MLPWLLFVLLVGVVNVVRCQQGPIKHNLPPGVELVDPKSLGFDESQLDLSSLLGNVKLTPINSNVDPKTGLKTQVLTVGFDGEENINLDDFELPQQPGGNNSELVQTAFNSFKDYFKNSKQATGAGGGGQAVAMETKVAPQQRRRKVVKKPQQPKVVELESEQIEKLLATGKLKSKKIGDSQVIEITQDQLNELYAMENGGEFKSLLGGEAQQIQEVVRQPEIVALPQQPQIQEVQVPRQPPQQVVRQPQQQIPQQPQQQQTTPPPPPPPPTTTPTTKPHLPTPPPIIYQFNTNDFEPQQNYRLTSPQQQQFPRQPQYFQSPQQQIQKHIKTPTFEFISVPPVSYSTAVQPEKQDPLPPRGKVYFPSQSGARFNRGLTPEQLNTFYEDDGLNYKDNSSSGSDDKDVERLRGV